MNAPAPSPMSRLFPLLLPAVLATLVVIAGLVQPSFLAPRNIQDILTQAAPLCLVVIGQTFVILLRGLDLSVASVMATVAVIAAAFNATTDALLPVILLAAFGFSVTVGIVNGFLVVKRNVSPFLATLAVMIVLQGGRFYYTQGAPGGTLPPGLRYLGTGLFHGVPVNLIVCLAVLVAMAFLLGRTALGRKIYITGGNPRSADLVGINSHRITMLGYVISAVMAGLAGLLLVGYVGTVDNWVGRGYDLDSIVAAVIGGVALTGGRGSLLNAVVGALILVLVFNLVIIIGLPVQAQFILKGIIIIVAAAAFAWQQEAR